jgi:hypothetical protein
VVGVFTDHKLLNWFWDWVVPQGWIWFKSITALSGGMNARVEFKTSKPKSELHCLFTFYFLLFTFYFETNASSSWGSAVPCSAVVFCW